MDLLRLTATVTLAIFAGMIAFDHLASDGSYVTFLDAFQVGAVAFAALIVLCEFFRRNHQHDLPPRTVTIIANAVKFGSLAAYLGFWFVVLYGYYTIAWRSA